MKRQRTIVALLLALPLLVLWRPLLLGETFYTEDLSAQYFPREALLRRSGLAGWNPHVFLGMGLAGDPQSAAYEPVRALARRAGLDARRGLVLYLGFYLLVATVGTWVCARRFGASVDGAALAVLAFVWGGTYVVRFRHPWMFPSMAFIPWVAWAAERLVADGRARDAALIGFFIAWGALGGHPQPAYMSWLFAATTVAFGTWRAVPPGWRAGALARQAARLAGGAVVFAALVAVAYAPVVRQLLGSARGAGGGFAFAASFPFNPWDWPRLLAPDLYGNDLAGTHFGTRNYHEQTCFLGVAPLALFVLALAWRAGPVERRLAPLALGFLALAAGPFLPPFYFAYALLPGFRLFRAACRYSWFFSLLAAVVAGLTLTRIAAGERPAPGASVRRRLGRGLAAAALACAAGAVVALAWPGMDRLTRPGAHWTCAWAAARAAFFLAASGAVLDAWLAQRLAPRGTVRALLLLTALDLAAQWLPYRQTLPPAGAFPHPAVVRALAAARPGRVFVYTAKRRGETDIVPLLNWGEAAGYDDLRGYNQAAPREVVELLARADVSGRKRELPDALGNVEPADWLLDLAGVSRLAARAADWPARWRALPVEAEGGGWQVRRRAGALPRAWLVAAVERASPSAALARLPAIDPRGWAIVDEGAALELPGPERRGPAGEARVAALAADEVIVEVRAASPALAILADRFDAGWSVEVDGAPRPLLRADGLLRGVTVSPGAHRLRFHYR